MTSLLALLLASSPVLLDIDVKVEPGRALSVSVRNRTKITLGLPHNAYHDVVFLEIEGPDGKLVPVKDERDTEKPSREALRWWVDPLQEGASRTVLELTVSRSSRGYELRWSARHARGLPPGKYRVKACWDTRQVPTDVGDADAFVWRARLDATEVELTLP